MITGTPCTTPKFERKTAFEMAQLIADKMGTKDKFDEGKTEEQWIRDLYEQARAKNAALPTFEEAQEKGVVVTKGKKKISMEKFIADPVASALDTPSGKIEIFSEKLLKDTVGWKLRRTIPFPAWIPWLLLLHIFLNGMASRALPTSIRWRWAASTIAVACILLGAASRS